MRALLNVESIGCTLKDGRSRDSTCGGFQIEDAQREWFVVVSVRTWIGENIIRLSMLDGLTFDIYKNTVLPKILEIIVICKDTLA